MMQAEITAIYAALTALLFLALAYRVVANRRRARVGLGTGGDEQLERAIRVHGNLAEYAAITLLLMLCYEINGGVGWLLHLAGGAFVVARVLHAQGMSTKSGVSRGRFYGILTSWIVILVMSFANLWQAI